MNGINDYTIQGKFSSTNHIYKITNDIDLGGSSLTIPKGCTIDFQGGNFKNGELILDGTRILPNGFPLNMEVTISGTYAVGQCIFDTSLGKPKWWTGTKWVDSTGADV